MRRQLTLFDPPPRPKLILEPALPPFRLRAGDVAHVLDGEIVGIDSADGTIYRLAPRWGKSAEQVMTVCEREGWDYRALSAAGAYVRSNPHKLFDPEIVARALPRARRSALAGLVGSRAGRYAETWHYDRVSAYPSLALKGVPSPTGWRIERVAPQDPSACGFVFGRFEIVDWSALADSAADPPLWLTIDEYRHLIETGAMTRAVIDYALITERRNWEWFVQAQQELYEKRLMHPEESEVYKLALNGIIGRLASGGGYERWMIGRGDYAISVGKGRYISYCVLTQTKTTRAKAFSVTADIVARQRIDLARLVAKTGAVWWYVDAITVTSPLPPEVTGTSPGYWRFLGSGKSEIIDWRGGIVAGKRKIACLNRAHWDEVLCG